MLHLVVTDRETAIYETLDNALQLLNSNVEITQIVVTGGGSKSTADTQTALPNSKVKIARVSNQSILEFITADNLPPSANGCRQHDQSQWKEFFTTLEPLQTQCLVAGRRLISILSEIRTSDAQGAPNRRQLHSQHRLLSRALMDTELQTLRRTGAGTIKRLHERARRISRRIDQTKNPHELPAENRLPAEAELAPLGAATSSCSKTVVNVSSCRSSSLPPPEHVQQRLNEVVVVFNEVDRAAKRLEALTEQRRERIREMTRQKAVEEEISEVRTCSCASAAHRFSAFFKIIFMSFFF